MATLFPSGQIVSTPNALEQLTPIDISKALNRHLSGDWGDLEQGDAKANDQALKDGDRLLSAYQSAASVKFWIITEADRSVTTILMPEDY